MLVSENVTCQRGLEGSFNLGASLRPPAFHPTLCSILLHSYSVMAHSLFFVCRIQLVASVMLAPHIAEHFANLAQNGPDVIQSLSMMYVSNNCEQVGSVVVNDSDAFQPISIMHTANDSHEVAEQNQSLAYDPSFVSTGFSDSAVGERLIVVNDSNEMPQKILGVAHDSSGLFVSGSDSTAIERLFGYMPEEDFSEGQSSSATAFLQRPSPSQPLAERTRTLCLKDQTPS